MKKCCCEMCTLCAFSNLLYSHPALWCVCSDGTHVCTFLGFQNCEAWMTWTSLASCVGGLNHFYCTIFCHWKKTAIMMEIKILLYWFHHDYSLTKLSLYMYRNPFFAIWRGFHLYSICIFRENVTRVYTDNCINWKNNNNIYAPITLDWTRFPIQMIL